MSELDRLAELVHSTDGWCGLKYHPHTRSVYLIISDFKGEERFDTVADAIAYLESQRVPTATELGLAWRDMRTRWGGRHDWEMLEQFGDMLQRYLEQQEE